jgi:uncharacterized protein
MSENILTEQATAADQGEPTRLFRPLETSERLPAIDFVRGLALLGILVVNTSSLFGPLLASTDPRSVEHLPWWDQLVFVLVTGLFAGKFISTFSMLFGYGLLSQIERAEAAGRSAVLFTLRRLAALAVFGLIHALGLWYGDILFVYAGLGGILLLVRRVSARGLLVIAGILLAINILITGGFQSLNTLFSEPLPTAPQVIPEDAPRGFEAMSKGPISPEWIQGEILAFREGPFADAFAYLLVNWLILLVFVPFFVACQIVGMFLLGGWMWRVRFFDPAQAGLRRQVLRFTLPLGLLLACLAMGLLMAGLQGSRPALVASVVAVLLSIPFLPLGYAALFSLLSERLPAWVSSPVICAGRMALTVYLLETVLATWLSYWWGWQLFGRVGPAWQLLIAVAIWSVLVLFASVWLRLFRRGPMENLWRWLEYGRLAS